MATAKVEPLDMKLEVVVLGVSDVDRAKAFYEKLGWRLDADHRTGTAGCSRRSRRGLPAANGS
jgi:predicted enzyme related to lactoylglutathione lyase